MTGTAANLMVLFITTKAESVPDQKVPSPEFGIPTIISTGSTRGDEANCMAGDICYLSHHLAGGSNYNLFKNNLLYYNI